MALTKHKISLVLDPDQSDFVLLAAEVAGNAGHRAHRYGMVADNCGHSGRALFWEWISWALDSGPSCMYILYIDGTALHRR
jgi:hypothetical protein